MRARSALPRYIRLCGSVDGVSCALRALEAKQRQGRKVDRRTVTSSRSIITNFRPLWQRLDSEGVLIQRKPPQGSRNGGSSVDKWHSKMSGYQTHGFARLW